LLLADLREIEIVVIGAGIAGLSLAAELASHFSVLVLDLEDHLSYHATGRSAAIFAPSYGDEVVRALSAASLAFFNEPGVGFAEHPLLRPRGVLQFGSPEQSALLDERYDALRQGGLRVERLAAAAAARVAPVFREGVLGGAIYEPDAADIDVHGLVSGYVGVLRAAGARLVTGARVMSAEVVGDRWLLQTQAGPLLAGVVVNAAGAWADDVASLFGVEPVGLAPLRRTVVVVDAPGWPLDELPFCVALSEDLYFKPDAGQLLVSPADETLQAPGDAMPDEMDIAVTIDRLERATSISVRRILASWAGLRTSVSDKGLVIGPDHRYSNFFWLAGQGGYGVQTAPAAARVAANLLGARPRPGAWSTIDASAFSPSRPTLRNANRERPPSQGATQT